MTEDALLEDADRRARRYLARLRDRPVFPDATTIARLQALSGPLPEEGAPALETLDVLDTVAGPATVASNDGRYFGFVIGASLPIAAAADRLVLAWDQAASSYHNSPAAHLLEKQAAGWTLDVLDLPRESAVGFTTSAGAGTITALTAARRELLARAGWDFDRRGVEGAPSIRVVVSDLAHTTVRKALRVLGFGLDRLVTVPTDRFGRIDPATMPPLDECTILVLQAGEVNTGEFDPFTDLIPVARRAGSWVHVDGAFGLWARASRTHHGLAEGVDAADSWTTDAHKWLNTPYDGAMVIVRDAAALAGAMNADAVYSSADVDSQKNLTLEFSRRARGVPVWAALRTLGHRGVSELVDRNIRLAQDIGAGLRDAGYTIHNRVVLNQVLASADTAERTEAVIRAAQRSGRVWFGRTVWQGTPAFRISVSSWRTQQHHVDDLVALLGSLS
jgi:glutamate/tyrosine decarboxylase-like PLP-dependent enzyme